MKIFQFHLNNVTTPHYLAKLNDKLKWNDVNVCL